MLDFQPTTKGVSLSPISCTSYLFSRLYALHQPQPQRRKSLLYVGIYGMRPQSMTNNCCVQGPKV